MNYTDKTKKKVSEKNHDDGDDIIDLTDKLSDLSENNDSVLAVRLEKTMERVIEKMFS